MKPLEYNKDASFEFYEYKGITFPVRDCEFTNGESTIRRRIGSEVMSGVLFSGKDNTWLDEEAEHLDSMIQYYIPHQELLTLSDQEILDYIYYHVDSDIYDDFN